MANDFSKITIDGTTYNVKVPNKLKFGSKEFDGSSEKTITASDLGLSNALHFIGETTTALSDGSNTSSIQIGSTTHTATTGDVVLYESKEFVWQGSVWKELGDGSSHALKTISISAGSGLTGGGTLEANRTISHADTSSQASVSASGRRYITGVTLDGYGHVTGLTTGTETVTAPTVNNGTLTIQKNGTSVGEFTANQSGNTTANITVPTTASDVGAAPKTAGVYLVKGNTTGNAGTWTGTSSDFTDYYDGLVVAYDIGIAGASTTTLNINDNGAKTVYLRGTTKLTTHYAVGTIILLVYSADANCWYKADYDSNGNTSVRVYRQTSGYDADYPILVSRTKTADIATVGTNNSNEGVYAVIANNGANTPTINPHTGAAKFATVTATTFNGNLSGNATTATTADNATKLNGQAASYYENKVTSVNGKTGAVTIDIPDISGKANLEGGNTFTGKQTLNSPASDGYSINASGYVKGSWLQAPSTGKAASNTGKVCVLDGSGWIYYRTPAEIVSDGAFGTWSSGTSGTVTLPSAGLYEVKTTDQYTLYHFVVYWDGASSITSEISITDIQQVGDFIFVSINPEGIIGLHLLNIAGQGADLRQVISYRKIGIA